MLWHQLPSLHNAPTTEACCLEGSLSDPSVPLIESDFPGKASEVGTAHVPLSDTHLHTCSGSCGWASSRCCGSVLPSSLAAVMLPPAPPMCTTRDAGMSSAPAVGTSSLSLRRADDRNEASAELTARLER